LIGGVIPSSNTKSLWDLFLKKDFPEVIDTPIYQEMANNRRDLYIALGLYTSLPRTLARSLTLSLSLVCLARSRFSPVGLPFPGYPLILKKMDPIQRQHIERFIKANQIRPFWVLHLHYTNSRTRRIAGSYFNDPTSYFKHVLYLNEMNRLLVEGIGMVWIPVHSSSLSSNNTDNNNLLMTRNFPDDFILIDVLFVVLRYKL
jgi:hypothetical protein